MTTLLNIERITVYKISAIAIAAVGVIFALHSFVSNLAQYSKLIKAIKISSNNFIYDASSTGFFTNTMTGIFVAIFCIFVTFLLVGIFLTEQEHALTIILSLMLSLIFGMLFVMVASFTTPTLESKRYQWIEEQTGSSQIKQITTYSDRENSDDAKEIYSTNINTFYEITKTKQGGKVTLVIDEMVKAPELVDKDGTAYIKE
jgi:hypothetical protein